MGLAKKRRSEGGGRAWAGAFTFPSCPLFCQKGRKGRPLDPECNQGRATQGTHIREAKTLGCKDGSLGAPQGQKEGSGISAPHFLLVGCTELVRTQSSISGARLSALS